MFDDFGFPLSRDGLIHDQTVLDDQGSDGDEGQQQHLQQLQTFTFAGGRTDVEASGADRHQRRVLHGTARIRFFVHDDAPVVMAAVIVTPGQVSGPIASTQLTLWPTTDAAVCDTNCQTCAPSKVRPHLS